MKDYSSLDILDVIAASESPMGATTIGKIMNIPPATIGRKIKELADAGYLTSVSNKGRIVTKKGLDHLATLNSLEAQKQAAQKLIDYSSDSSINRIEEILQVRKLIEPTAAALASQLADAAAIEELDLYNLEHELMIKKGLDGEEQDLEIHLLIAKSSGNSILYQMLKLLLVDNNVYRVLGHITSSLERHQVTSHSDLIAAIKAKDAPAAERAMNVHLDRIIENVLSYKAMKNSDLAE